MTSLFPLIDGTLLVENNRNPIKESKKKRMKERSRQGRREESEGERKGKRW